MDLVEEPQRTRPLGVTFGTVGAILTLSAIALAVLDSWRAWERCTHAPRPVGATSEFPIDSHPSLLPLGYRCVWQDAESTVSVTFANWPLTIALVAGLVAIVVAGWLIAQPARS